MCVIHSLEFRENSQSHSQKTNHFSRNHMKCSSWQLLFSFFVCVFFFFVFFYSWFHMEFSFLGQGQWGFIEVQFAVDVLKQNICSGHSWTLLSFRLIHFNVKGWCFYTYVIQVTHNVCCICYEGLYLALVVSKNLGELNLLNTQNNLLKEPQVKTLMVWLQFFRSKLKVTLIFSWTHTKKKKKVFQGQNFKDHVIGKMFIKQFYIWNTSTRFTFIWLHEVRKIQVIIRTKSSPKALLTLAVQTKGLWKPIPPIIEQYIKQS